MDLGRLQGPDRGHRQPFLAVDPQDLLALCKITRWPLGDIQDMAVPDFHFWLSEAAQFQEKLNAAAASAQES